MVSCVSGLLGSGTCGWLKRRGFSSSACHGSAVLPEMCLSHSLGTEPALELRRAWHQLCPCRSCRQVSVRCWASTPRPPGRSSRPLLQGLAPRQPRLAVSLAQPAVGALGLRGQCAWFRKPLEFSHLAAPGSGPHFSPLSSLSAFWQDGNGRWAEYVAAMDGLGSCVILEHKWV